MKLEVVYDLGSSSAAAPAHCSVSLPVAVASSLAGIQPFAALVVLRLETVAVDIPAFSFRSARRAGAGKQQPVFVGWSGGTVDKPYSIGIHPAFAGTLGLGEGMTVSATIVERVVSKRASRTVRTATLRPVVYDACEGNGSGVVDAGTSGPKNSTTRIADPFEKAVEQFALLSGTADALERTILGQVRVLFVGLVFPLHLPGRESVSVRVVQMSPAGDAEPGDSRTYALLVPDSEVEVESPPVRASEGEGDVAANKEKEERVVGFYRVVSQGKSAMASLPAGIANTHAILPVGDAGARGVGRTRYALVSRKGDAKKQLALPVAFTFHAACPSRHISLPPALWKDLKLTPLTPVFVDEVPPFRRGERVMNAKKLPENPCPLSPPFVELAAGEAVYYDGMCLREMQICLSGSERPAASGMQLPNDIDLWDKEGVKEQEGVEVRAVDDVFAAVESSSPAELVQTARSKRLVREGFRAFPGQTLHVVDADTADVISKAQPARARLSGRPLKRVETQQHSLLSLTVSGRNAIEAIVSLSRPLFGNGTGKPRKENVCKAAVLEGALGSGKTHICKAAASLLRELANVRTIWIRGKVHSGESNEASMKRVRRAFAAAADGGPGVVVLDDVDMLFGNRKSNQEGETDAPDVTSERRRHVFAQEIEDQITRVQKESVLLLMTCEKAKDLEVSLRSPGLVRTVVQLPLPTADERSLLYWMAMQGLNFSEPTREELLRIRRDVASLDTLSEGYSPKDIHISLKRARIALKLIPVAEEEVDMSQIVGALRDVLKKMTPSSRSGISFSKEKAGETLSWSRIGALENAKSAIWEALQLPSVRPDVFSNVPIRLPHGILLYGPPGCGKTMLARTAAVESGMRCVMVKGPELLSKYIGESEAEVRRAFEKAASSTPCVLLFDEFDSLAPRRGGESTGVADRVVNTLLTCMDGAERLSEGVYIIATTSRPELIDPALLRPGRLDRWIPVDIPSTVGERMEILKCLCRRFFASTPSIEAALEQLAEDTDGYTGADLGAIINDAHLSFGKGRTELTKDSGGSFVPELLNKAVRQSRPSLSRSQREYFMGIMNQFAPQDSRKENGSIEGNIQKTAQLFGKRVALQ